MQATCQYCGVTFEAQRSTARFCSEAHRQAAHRLSRGGSAVEQSGVEPLVEADETAAQAVPNPTLRSFDEAPKLGGPIGEEMVEFDGTLMPVVRTHSLSEDEYAAMERRHTLAAVSRGLKDPDGKRADRAEAHARFRYRGWQVGEIRSL